MNKAEYILHGIQIIEKSELRNMWQMLGIY